MNEGWWRCTGAKLYKRKQERKEEGGRKEAWEWMVVCCLPTGLQLALSGAQMTQNQRLSLLSSTSRDLHGTDLIYTDWSSSNPIKCDLSATFLYITTTNLDWKLSFLSVLMLLIDLLCLYCILYRHRKVCMYLPISLTSVYLFYYIFFMVLLLDSEKAV